MSRSWERSLGWRYIGRRCLSWRRGRVSKVQMEEFGDRIFGRGEEPGVDDGSGNVTVAERLWWSANRLHGLGI